MTDDNKPTEKETFDVVYEELYSTEHFNIQNPHDVMILDKIEKLKQLHDQAIAEILNEESQVSKVISNYEFKLEQKEQEIRQLNSIITELKKINGINYIMQYRDKVESMIKTVSDIDISNGVKTCCRRGKK